jgi:hypothetical protein
MKKLSILSVLIAITALSCADRVQATTLVYSYETGIDGFAANGGGITVSQDTIGATDGTHSMKVAVVGGATFVGALTTFLPPAIGDPPGIDYILFDMTIPQQFTGAFALVGVTMFGFTQPDYPGGQQYGLQAQFADFEHIGGKAAGTYSNIRIDLTSATHGLTFAPNQSFDQIFGTAGSGPDDLLPSGFQLFFNKSNDEPLVVYIDNVRVGLVPEPGSLVLFATALVGLFVAGWRRRKCDRWVAIR